MLRRTFFQRMGFGAALLVLPRWFRPELAEAAPTQAATITDLASAVLPESLNEKRIGETAAAFEEWIKGYPAGADAGYGYGNTRLTVLGANPSLHYADQLSQLDTAAADAGGFAAASLEAKRTMVRAALTQAGVAAIPMRPNGQHLATDLMSYFYGSSDGKDFCYGVAIREADCRGLDSSERRPDAVS
jgi:hypothetical protein